MVVVGGVGCGVREVMVVVGAAGEGRVSRYTHTGATNADA